MAKFDGNTLCLSENIAKSFREATFLTRTVCDKLAPHPATSNFGWTFSCNTSFCLWLAGFAIAYSLSTFEYHGVFFKVPTVAPTVAQSRWHRSTHSDDCSLEVSVVVSLPWPVYFSFNIAGW